MKILSTLLIIVGLCFSPAFAKGNSGYYNYSSSQRPTIQKSPSDVSVQSYTRKDGTDVTSYKRTKANETEINNFSTKGNVNPYTGEVGTKIPTK
ncbi:MAG: hypothetical protein H6Q35_392 [Proteobacteria bacterium]|nr:hypothetical protein [Pseudomonadota bacterium]